MKALLEDATEDILFAIERAIGLGVSLYTILQILRVTVFERMTLIQTLSESHCETIKPENNKQLKLVLIKRWDTSDCGLN